LMTAVGQRFVQHRLPPSIPELAEELRVPARLLREIAQTLAAERLLAEIAVAAQEPAYLPTRPLEATTCHDILLALRATRGQELATRDEPIRGEVYGEFHRIEEAERQAASKITLLDLVHHARPQIAGGSPSDSGS
jgi:DNA-binding IscR family transcriptional regulator